MLSTHHKFYLATIVLALGVAGVAAYYFVQTERHTDATMADLDKAAIQLTVAETAVNATLKGTHKNGDDGLLFRTSLLVANADSTMHALEETAQTINATSKANAAKAGELADASIAAVQTGKTSLTALGLTLGELDGTVADLRRTTLPKLDAGIDSLGNVVIGLRPVEDNAAALLVSGTQTFNDLQGTITRANGLLDMPEMKTTISNFASTSGHLNGLAANGEELTGEIRDMFKPSGKLPFFESLAVTAAKYAAGPVAGALITHWWPQRESISGPVQVIPSK